MPKNFIFFLAATQGTLLLFHGLVYFLLISFFPGLAVHWLGLFSVILILSVSFLTVTLLDYKYDGPILRAAYLISSIWLVFAFYFSIAAAITLIASNNGLLALPFAGWLAIAASLLLVFYGLINARITRVINLKIKLPNLPQQWQGRRAVMVSDIHLGHILHLGFAKKIVALINAQNPDIVFIPGDFYDGVHTDFNGLAGVFKNITAPLGVYFSSGNHEMFAGYNACETALKNAGIKILEDEKIEVQGMQIAGLAYTNETDESVTQRLKALSLDMQKPSILLKHVPSHILPIAQAGVSLQLSGHSHLGQIWPFRYVTRKLFKGFDYGLKTLKQLQVYTSSGAGTWGPPMRVFTKSEIVKIVFQ